MRDQRLTILANVRRLMRGRVRNQCNWVMIMEIWGTGSTKAHAMCEEMGLDPYAFDDKGTK